MVLILHDLLLDQLDDRMASFHQLFFDLHLVMRQSLQHPLIFSGFGPHRLDDLELGPSRRNYIFVCGGTEIAFGGGELLFTKENLVGKSQHLLVAFGLLGKFGQEDIILFFKVLHLHIYTI